MKRLRDTGFGEFTKILGQWGVGTEEMLRGGAV